MPDAWEQFEPDDAAPWSLRRVVHLHRRAGFGATWREIQRDLHDGPNAAVDRLLKGTSRIGGVPEGFEPTAAEIADAAVISGDPERLKAWWFYRMICSPNSLAERLTLMWHNHFATSNFKVRDLAIMRRQNNAFRKLAKAPFKELLTAVLHDPAVLIWLDAASNRKGYANENLSRELMELFTLGAGNYTEQDVKEAARALTGWSVTEGSFVVRPQWHDDGEKVILRRRGKWDGDDLVCILIEQPATSRRLAWRICNTFLGDKVADDIAIDALASGLREHDLSIDRAVETVLRSRLFFSDSNIATKVIGPVEFLVGPLRALEMFDPPPSTLVLAEWSARLGQDLFYPPNVGGWAGARAWLSTRTIIARANYAAALVRGALNTSPAPPDLWALARTAGRRGDLMQALGFFNELLLGGALDPRRLDEMLKDPAGSAGTETEVLRDLVARLLARPEGQLG